MVAGVMQVFMLENARSAVAMTGCALGRQRDETSKSATKRLGVWIAAIIHH